MEIGAISEDKALKVLERVKMLRKLREKVILHPDLKARLKKCEPALDLPDWWVNGKHDRDLLFGVAR
jgi:chromodomain-helicase-DNA-binding protein 7